MTALEIGVAVILAVATAANLVLLFAVIRRLRMLEARAPEAHLTEAPPAPGTQVASFRATDTAGVQIDDSGLAGGPHLVAFVMTACDPCHAVLSALRDDARFDPAQTLILVAGNSDSPQTQQVLDLADGLGRTVIVDYDGPVGAAFGGIGAFPTLLSVRDGQVELSGRDLDDVAPASVLSPVG